MKLFDGFEVVRFPEENLLFVAHDGYLYYIYNSEYEFWQKHKNAGNDSITVCNYQEVTKEEVIDAMNGTFPRKETDFMRLCSTAQLCIRDMIDLFNEDYPDYMSDGEIYHAVHRFLLESNICHKSFLKLDTLFENALSLKRNNSDVLVQIKELCLAVVGRDIFKCEIGIVDGHDSSSYFWIMPVRVVDYNDTNGIDNVAEMRSIEISIEEDDDGNEQMSYVSGFEWYLTHNFYSFDSMTNILNDINDTIEALASGSNNEFTEKLREKRGTVTYELLYARDLSAEQINEYNANRPKEDNTEIELITDFYRRFIYRMEYMMKVGKEKGYDLISFMGP